MKSTRTFLILALTLAAVFTTPAISQASSDFTMGGKGLTKVETETFEGTFNFTSSAGGISCPVKTEVELEPGSTGKVKTFAPTKTESCTYSGNLDNLCGVVDTHTATGLPWTAHAEEVSGVKVIRISTPHLDLGGTGLFCTDVTIKGDVVATPDKAGEISSVGISGTLESNLGTNVTAGGTLNAAHPKTWGI